MSFDNHTYTVQLKAVNKNVTAITSKYEGH